MTFTLGVLASQKAFGPYTLTYAGRTDSSGGVNTLSGNYNLGTEYYDRIVFIGVWQAYVSDGTASSVTVGGKTATKIGGNATVGLVEWWYVAQNTGTSSVPVQVNFASAQNCAFVVYVLGGGALGGLTPTIELATGYANNSNNTYANFSAANANDLFMGISTKVNGGASSCGNIISNMSPVTNTSNRGVGTDNDGSASANVGPVSATASPYLQATGFDSSKSIQIAAIRIQKKP